MVGLQKRLQRYFYLFNQGFDFIDEIKLVKKEMSEVKSRGAVLRSKEKEIEDGEKCTRYIFKKNMNRGGAMVNLKDRGDIKTDTKGILTVVEGFYEELYKEQNSNQSILNEILSFVDKTVKDSGILTKDFNLLEIDKSVTNFKRGKSSGADGLPLEFYLTF